MQRITSARPLASVGSYAPRASVRPRPGPPRIADHYAAVRDPRGKSLAAPPAFVIDGRKIVFGDIRRVDSVVVLDVAKRRTTVKAVVEVMLSEAGQPAIELVPKARVLRVDGKLVDPAAFADVGAPAGSSRFRVVGLELSKGKHTVEITYDLAAGVRYTDTSVELRGHKFDLDPRMMDEQYFPTNLEYDQYPGSITFDIRGTSVRHRVMTNGEVSHVGGDIQVRYPAHFNTASLFVNVIDPARFAIGEAVHRGVTRSIPITVYKPTSVSNQVASAKAVSRAIAIAKAALTRHEIDIGPYPHPRLLVRLQSDGGMEYAGAAETSLDALAHELHHQWLARSAQPANGNAGWIDEAAAAWHDRGYPRSLKEPTAPSKLSGYSPWHRVTPRGAYTHGSRLMAYLDGIFAPRGGLRPLLAKFFATYTKRVFTNEMFLAFLKKEGRGLGVDFDALFAKHVYGRARLQAG